MSLDVYLNKPGGRGESSTARIFVREGGATKEISREEWDRRHPDREPVVAEVSDGDEVYSRNITHNLGRMADAAGLYAWLWRPEEVAARKAADLIEPLRVGLDRLLADPDKYKALNPENGWGDYAGLVAFVADHLAACEAHPDADVTVSR